MAMKFMNSDSLFSRVFERIFDLIILNILWAVCCVPVVTAGASTSALYYMTLKMARGESFAVIKDFAKAFRQNFLKATILWIFILIPGATLAMGYYYIYSKRLTASMGALMLALFCTVLYLLLITYLFPLQARFENAVAGTIINSFILGVRYFPRTFVIWLCWLVPLVFTMWSVTYLAVMSLLWILFGVSAIAWLTSIIYTKVFDMELKRGEEADVVGEEVDIEQKEDAAREGIETGQKEDVVMKEATEQEEDVAVKETGVN